MIGKFAFDIKSAKSGSTGSGNDNNPSPTFTSTYAYLPPYPLGI